MPILRNLAVLSCVALLAACATSPSGEGVYRESTVDMVNRAPAAMSIPPDVDRTLDNDNMRAQADFHFTLGETFALEGNSSRAVEEYRLTLMYDQASVQVRLRLAAEYVKQGMVNEAVKQAKAAAEIDEKSIEPKMLLGGLYSSLRTYDEALKQYEAVQKLAPENDDAPMFIGALYAEQKKFTEAASRFEKLAKDPENGNAHVAWYYLGRVRLEESKEDVGGKAEYAFKQAVQVKPSFVDPLLSLGALYESTGRKDKALALFATYQEKHGPSAVVAETLAQMYLEKEDYAKALKQFAIIEAAEPEDLNAKVKTAFILIQEKRYQEAIVKLEELLAKMPTADKIRFYLGAVFEEVKNYKAAIPHFLQIQRGSSFFAESRIHASYLHKLLNESDKAIEVIEAAIKEMPDHAPFYTLYASHLDDRHDYKKAISMLTESVARFPQNAQLFYFLGNMHDRVGDKSATIETMKKVLAIEEDHVQALNYLAYTYADSGGDLESAETLARRALKLKPQDGYVLDTLGWVLFKKGLFEESVKFLEDAHRLQPEEAIIADHLGDAYYYFRMPERAKRLYEKAASLAEEQAVVAEKAARAAQAKGGNDGKTDPSSVSPEKIRAKIVIVDRQIDDFGKSGRRPASAK